MQYCAGGTLESAIRTQGAFSESRFQAGVHGAMVRFKTGEFPGFNGPKGGDRWLTH